MYLNFYSWLKLRGALGASRGAGGWLDWGCEMKVDESNKKVKDITVKIGSFRAATYMIISMKHARMQKNADLSRRSTLFFKRRFF